MFICEYCGRHLKKKYVKCPGCGGTSFKKVQNIGEEIIKKPPEGGYKVNLNNFKVERKKGIPAMIVGLWVLGFGAVFCAVFAFVGMGANDTGFPTGYIFVAFAIVAFISMIKTAFTFFKESGKSIQGSNKDINKIKYLAKNGMLIKNLKYKVKPVKGTVKGDKTVYRIQVLYEIEKGKTKCFESEPKYLTALGRDDGTVDMLIDPNDYSNYFIDFEIY